MKQKSIYNKANLRLKKPYGYWWDVIMGGLLTSLILISLGRLILFKTDLTYLFYFYSALCIVIVIYYQRRDDNLTTIKTGLSMDNNFSLVAASLDSLNWEYEQTAISIDLKSNKYILKFVAPTIVPENGKVYINFKYHTTSRTGRFPFFFGLSTYLEWTFQRRIKQILLHRKLEENTDKELQ